MKVDTEAAAAWFKERGVDDMNDAEIAVKRQLVRMKGWAAGTDYKKGDQVVLPDGQTVRIMGTSSETSGYDPKAWTQNRKERGNEL